MIFSECRQTIIMKTARLSAILSLILFVSISPGCNKENDPGTTELRIRMTDSPFDATEVNVDIQKVRVNLSDDPNGWTDLDTYEGIYNLLELQNGIDTLLAQGIVPTGMLKEIRFVLGNENSIKIDDDLYPLTIPSGSEAGLKIKVNKHLNATIDSLLIDFDAALSIIQTGTGEYKLKPVIKLK